MASYFLAALLAVTVATGFAQDNPCYKSDIEATTKFCKDKVAKEKPETKALEDEKMWNCEMCKLKVFHHADDDLNFTKLDEVINTYVVEGKQQEMKSAITECKPQYESAESKKIAAFYSCYGTKLKLLCQS